MHKVQQTKNYGTINGSETVCHTLSPVYDDNSRILILGTMPSPASRKYGFYYGHSQNRFWPVLADIFGEKYPASVSDKRNLALRHGIALWDVISCCRIAGADDASITDVIPNDIAGLIAKIPGINRIYTTGKKASELYEKYIRPTIEISSTYLPSTSPANRGRWPLEKLITVYRCAILGI